jgi:MFS transporter, DHA1 family, multidrug resistance protein
MIGVLGNAAAQFMFGMSSQLWMLFAARALAGILSSATLPTAMAYVSDSTDDRQRSAGMGMVLGPGMGGLVADISLSPPFFLAGELSLVALALVFLFLPEPPHPESARQGKIQGLNLTALWEALRGPLGMLFFLSFMLSFAMTNSATPCSPRR